MKQQVYIHHLDIYDCDLHIICTPDARRKVNAIYKKHNTGMVYKHYIAGMSLTLSMNTYYFIVNNNHVSYNTVCHELFHLACAITSDRDIHEEEARAWVQGLVANEIFKFLHQNGIEIAYD
jgi:hypothetical protein